MEHEPSNYAYYDGGFHLKGLPRTVIPSCWPVPLTWQDIKAIVEIADRMVTEDPNDHPDWLETEESYYKAVLDEYLKTKEK